jgi:Predicted membrane protein
MKSENLRELTLFSMFAAIVLIFGFTPQLGFIQATPGLLITTIHIPVIIGACALGWKYGAVLGGLFGVIGVIRHSFIAPGMYSYYFTPLYSVEMKAHGNVWSLVISIVPRILIGLVAGLVFYLLIKKKAPVPVAAGVAAACGTLTNTVLVLTGISVFFKGDGVVGLANTLVKTAVSINFVIELPAAIVLSVAIVPVLKKLRKA